MLDNGIVRPHALLLAVCLAAGCSPAADGADGVSGELLFRRQGCTQCHGTAGSGGSLGPPLLDVERHWTREELARYFADPRPFFDRKPHLGEISKRYASRMPAFSTAEDERLALADYVLGLSSSN